MIEFHEGDRVAIREGAHARDGEEGVITNYDGGPEYPYYVKFNDGYVDVFQPEHLELVEQPESTCDLAGEISRELGRRVSTTVTEVLSDLKERDDVADATASIDMEVDVKKSPKIEYVPVTVTVGEADE